MPNGQQARITHIGTVVLSPEIRLQDVLCVPKFQFNLLSVSKLTKQLGSYVIFTPNACLVQGTNTQNSMVLGKESTMLSSNHVMKHMQV